jgi:hypothetical protein
MLMIPNCEKKIQRASLFSYSINLPYKLRRGVMLLFHSKIEFF